MRENHGFVWFLIILEVGICMYYWWFSFLLGGPRTENTQSFVGNEAPRHVPEVLVMTKSQIAGYVAQQAVLEGVDPVVALRIATCESKLNPNAVNKKSSARGIMQITLATQTEVENNTRKKYNAFKVEDNVEMAFYFMKRGQWKRWVCK